MTQRTNPFDALERMFDRMSDEFQTAARSWETGDQLEFWPGTGEQMATDVLDADDEFIVTIDVPGFDREDIDVRVADDTLVVEAEHGEMATEPEHDRFIRKERTHHRLSRSVTLPTPVETETVSAKLTNGVLTITIPKAEPLTEGRTIEIEDE